MVEDLPHFHKTHLAIIMYKFLLWALNILNLCNTLNKGIKNNFIVHNILDSLESADISNCLQNFNEKLVASKTWILQWKFQSRKILGLRKSNVCLNFWITENGFFKSNFLIHFYYYILDSTKLSDTVLACFLQYTLKCFLLRTDTSTITITFYIQILVEHYQ